MSALAPRSPWIPEDDILLRNAVEAGASLESLAKGAVHFSRRFTVHELQDRWHSLLYDPVVSADASARMIECGGSTPTHPVDKSGNSKETKCESGKRKAESVRSSYYAMRKRICNEPFSNMGLNFLVAPGINNYVGNGNEPLYGNCMNEDPTSAPFGLERSDMNTLQSLMDDGTATGVVVTADTFHTGLGNADNIGMESLYTLDQINHDEGNMCSEYICNTDAFQLPDDIDVNNTRTLEYDVHLGPEVEAEMPCGDFETPAVPSSTEGYLAELSNSLLNFTNEELMLMTDEGKDVIDKSYYDGLSSLLLSSPKDDVCQEQAVGISEPESPVAQVTYSMNPSSAYPGVVEDNMGSHIAEDSETLMLSSSTASNFHNPELKDGVICCTLNTEDWDIPCNDDVILPNRFLQPSTSKVNKPMVDFASNQRTSDTGPCFMQKEQRNPVERHGSSQIKGSQFFREMGPKPPVGNLGDKFGLSKTDHSEVASNNAGPLPGITTEKTRESISTKRLSCNSSELHMENPDPDRNNSFESCPQTHAGVIEHELDPSAATRDHISLHAEAMPLHISVPETELNPQTSEQLGLYESDDDIPCYSDIEAMVLDKDLDTDDQDLYSREEVSKYQHENTKKRIIRLEQGTHSYLQRDIASHGAFAILYGRQSKHYIKKPEVLLGRATEDDIVDIDLGRVGCGNKVSRKQAIIRMNKGGSFFLKNLGKSPIFVNSKEVARGQTLTLSSSCLIEIREMPFIFETNKTRMQQYVDMVTEWEQL